MEKEVLHNELLKKRKRYSQRKRNEMSHNLQNFRRIKVMMVAEKGHFWEEGNGKTNRNWLRRTRTIQHNLREGELEMERAKNEN